LEDIGPRISRRRSAVGRPPASLERLLHGNTEILEHVEPLEKRIRQLEQRIVACLKPAD
jgi:hypothetical protein